MKKILLWFGIGITLWAIELTALWKMDIFSKQSFVGEDIALIVVFTIGTVMILAVAIEHLIHYKKGE